MSSAPTTRMTCVSKRDHQLTGKMSIARLRGTLTISTASSLMLVSPILIKYPVPGSKEYESSEYHDYHHQDPGHRCCITHLIVAKSLLIEVERIKQRGIGRAAIRHN